jgi:uncharacterized protein YukE
MATTTAQPTAAQLIPGDPQAVSAFARRLRSTGNDGLHPISVDQQQAEAATKGWVGAGGDAARTRLQATGKVWTTAAHVLDQLADAVERYARSLREAQADAAQAVTYQNQAKATSWSAVAMYYHAAAEVKLMTAKVQLRLASTTLAAAFDQGSATLPKPAAAVAGPDAKLAASPYQAGVLDHLAKRPGWGLEPFIFTGVNIEPEVHHVGVWGFVGAYVGGGVREVGTGDAAYLVSAGDIYGGGVAVGKEIPGLGGADNPGMPKIVAETGLLWEDGSQYSRYGLETFSSGSNPNLYFALTTSDLTPTSPSREVGLLIHNEPGEACVYTPFMGMEHPGLHGRLPVGPAEVSAGAWVGVGLSITRPSAAMTPYECIDQLPEFVTTRLPWWAHKAQP